MTDMPCSHPHGPLKMEAAQGAAPWQSPRSLAVSPLASVGPEFPPKRVESMNCSEGPGTEISLIALGVKLSCGLF